MHQNKDLKRVAIFRIRSMRFWVFDFTHVFIPKPVPTFGRHALTETCPNPAVRPSAEAIHYQLSLTRGRPGPPIPAFDALLPGNAMCLISVT